MPESITTELEFAVLQQLRYLRKLGDDGVQLCNHLRSRIRITLLTATSTDDAEIEVKKLLKKFDRKAQLMDGRLEERRAKKRARAEGRKKSAFVELEAGEGGEDESSDEEARLEPHD